MIRLALASLLLLSILSASVQADEGSEQDRARRAVEAGEILPLRDILAAASAAYGGQFVEAELEHEGGRWVYEIKLITGDGQLARLHYDAHSGALLQVRIKGGRHR